MSDRRSPTKHDFKDDWRKDALCRQVRMVTTELDTAWDNIYDEETDSYHSDPKEEVAKAICAECPVRMLCLKDAIKDSRAEGIRGGYRFEAGYMTKRAADDLWRELGLRGPVRKRPGNNDGSIRRANMSKMRETDG